MQKIISNQKEQVLPELSSSNQFKLAEKKLLNETELKAELQGERYISPHLGFKCLNELASGMGRQKFFQAIDKLVFRLRQIESAIYEDLGFPLSEDSPLHNTFQLRVDDTNLELQYVGSGRFGGVYSIKGENGTRYALKAYYNRIKELYFSGPWNEAALGIYITAQRISDMPHLCIASPETGWIITEFVDAKYKSSSPDGPSQKDLSLSCLDSEYDPDNQILGEDGNKYRVDYGHLCTLERSNPTPADIFDKYSPAKNKQKLMEGSEFMQIFLLEKDARKHLCGCIHWVKTEQRVETLKKVLSFKESYHFPLHNFITAKTISDFDIVEVFNTAMLQEDATSRGQVIFDIRELPDSDASYLKEQWESRAEFWPLRMHLGC